MKKIGILFGFENTFPPAFVEEVNSRNEKDIFAEFVKVEELMQGRDSGYAVIIDRISQDVPFYRAFLKNAASQGAAVINNPFWWSADEKFFNNIIAQELKVPVPKTVLLPSKDMPQDTRTASFRNLKYPLNWEMIFNYVGFPAYFKPHSGGGWKSVFKVHDEKEFFEAYNQTGQLVMMLQECIDFTDYYRCYCIGTEQVHIMPYAPRNPHHLRYFPENPHRDKVMMDTITDYVQKLNVALGYDFNTVEFAVKDGIPYAIDFCNPAPDAEITSVGEENFKWIIKAAADLAISRAQSHKPGQMNLRWGSFINQSTEQGMYLHKPAKKNTSKK